MNQKSYGLGLPTSSTESGDLGRLPAGYRDWLSLSHGRTDGLTKNNSPESVVSRNASPAGGQDESITRAIEQAALDLAFIRAHGLWDSLNERQKEIVLRPCRDQAVIVACHVLAAVGLSSPIPHPLEAGPS